MRIAFDLRRISNPGIGRYMKCLVEALLARDPEHEYLLIMLPGTEEKIAVSGKHAEKLTSRLKYYSVREQLELPGILRANRIDLLHSPHFMLPLLRACPSVVTIHDVIYLACKEDLPSRLGRLYYRGMMAASVRVASRIITDSSFSKQDIIRHLNVAPEKVDVIYPAAGAEFQRVSDSGRLQEMRSKYGISEDFVLYAGICKPRKNHTGLLRAFRCFLNAGGTAQLVFAGPTNPGEAELRRLAEDLGIARKVIFTGFVEESDLPALYSAARVYACPSFYEGFGFTVLEAMACGVPVVCSAETSLPEVAGDAALYADPRDPEQFGWALSQAWEDRELRMSLIQKGRDNVRRFSWEQAAEQTSMVYRQVLGIPDKRTVYA
ncbi:MAG TPA: glycosyltransferase family 1 protein [Candidatus Solibacter sp.]|jgi:glycosyltransferase involved in cell wall biosynthesis|nr:glycosyltransferase family 1 protein [Candidatus Solibacter sp.]